MRFRFLIMMILLLSMVSSGTVYADSAFAPVNAPIGSGMVTIPIPTSSPGLSINLVTGETSTTTDTPDGWDVQISGSLIFSANTSRPAREAGFVSRVDRKVAGTYNLPFGFEVGPNLPYLTGQQPTDVSDRPDRDQQYNWSFPGDANYVGVKFWNEATSAYHYGWMRFCVSGNISVAPRALVEYGYESTPDTPILVGDGGIGDPSDCGAGGLTEIVAPFCIDAADISSTTIDSLVLEATASCNELRFIQTELNTPPNVDYLTQFGRDDQTPWENTTMQGPAGKPVNIKFEGFNVLTQESQAYQIKIRTLTLKDVNLATGIFEVIFAGSPTDPTTAITLENAAIEWIRGDVNWQWAAAEPLTLTAGGGDNRLLGMIGVVPPTTNLTVANGSTLRCDQCGNTDPNRPDTDRLFFSNQNNQGDIDGGTLEIRNSYVIFGSGTSWMRVHDGGRLFLVGGDTVLRTGGDLTVDSGGIVELGLGGVILDTGEDVVTLDDGSIVVGSTGVLRTGAMFVNGSSTVSFGPEGAEVNADVVNVAAGQTLTLEGASGSASDRSGTLITGLLLTENGSLVRLNGESVLEIQGTGKQVWDDGSIEIGPDATLVINSGEVETRIPIDVGGTMRVEGVFLPGFDLAGNGILQIISGGILAKENLQTISIDPKTDMDPQSKLSMRIDPTAGQSARLIFNSAFRNDGAFLVLNVTNDKELLPDTKFTIIEYPDGNGAGELFRRSGDFSNTLKDGDEIIAGLNTYRINYNPTSVTLTVVGPLRVKANDDYYTALQDQTLTVPAPGVLENDVNVTGTPVVVDPPMHGTVTLNPDGSFTYTPDAGFFGDDSFTYQVGDSNVATVFIHVRAQADCTLTAGYWQTHAGTGGAALDTTWLQLPLGPQTPFFLSGETYLEVLSLETRGNPYYILAQQYVAAELNFLRGADPATVQAEFDAAKALFEQYTPADIAGLPGDDPLRTQFIDLAYVLDQYNNGYIGPGHCSEESVVSAASSMETSATVDSSNRIYLPAINGQ